MTRLSCHRFRSNEVRLWLSVIAYNVGNLWRRCSRAMPWPGIRCRTPRSIFFPNAALCLKRVINQISVGVE